MGAERPETRDQITLMGACSTSEHPPILDRVNTFPYEGKGDHVVVDEVRDSPKRPTFEHPHPFRRVKAFPS